MGVLAAFVGETPRVKLLEALLRLGAVEFSRAELAKEADLFPMTVSRVLPGLVRDSLVFQVTQGKRPLYRVNELSARLWLLSRVGAGLSIIESEGMDAPGSDATKEAKRRALGRIQTPLAYNADDIVAGVLSLQSRPSPVPRLLPLTGIDSGAVYDFSLHPAGNLPAPRTQVSEPIVVEAPLESG